MSKDNYKFQPLIIRFHKITTDLTLPGKILFDSTKLLHFRQLRGSYNYNIVLATTFQKTV